MNSLVKLSKMKAYKTFAITQYDSNFDLQYVVIKSFQEHKLNSPWIISSKRTIFPSRNQTEILYCFIVSCYQQLFCTSTVADLTLGEGGRPHTILPNFPKNCMKLKEFRPVGGDPCRIRKPLYCHLCILQN